MSFFKSFLTHKSDDMPLDTAISSNSKEVVQTQPRMRSLSPVLTENVSSSKYLNMVNQKLSQENEMLKCKVDDLKMTVDTNKQLLEEFISTNSKMDRKMKILDSQAALMSSKLRESGIDYVEHLDVMFDDKKYARSNSPTMDGPLSTLTTDRVAKGATEDKTRSEYGPCTTSLSANHSDDKHSARLNKHSNHSSIYQVGKPIKAKHPEEEKKTRKKVVKRRQKRDSSVISSNSSQNMTSYRTAPIFKPTLVTSSNLKHNELLIKIQELEKELEQAKADNSELRLGASHNKSEVFEKIKISGENVEEYEEPVSFRDNLLDEDHDKKIHIECELEMEEYDEETKNIKIKKLSKWHNKGAIMKLFDHIDDELTYNCYFENTKKGVASVLYFEDDQQRVWEVKKADDLKPRNLDSLSSLKSLDSPMSLASEDLRFSTQGAKNKTAVLDFAKLNVGFGKECKIELTLDSDCLESHNLDSENLTFPHEIIDYQSIQGNEEELAETISFNRSSNSESPDVNCFELY